MCSRRCRKGEIWLILGGDHREILEQKGVVASRRGEKRILTERRFSREEYEALSLRHLANHLFHGDSSSMVMRLLSDDGLSARNPGIRKILDERSGE